MINNRFKTAMCKHFQQTGACPIGAKCNFAHGQEELRGINDPIPLGSTPISHNSKPSWNFSGQQQQEGGQSTHSNQRAGGPGNFKTTKCKFFEKGFCKFSTNCQFAHGDQQVRSPNSFATPLGSHQSNPAKTSMPTTSSLQNQVASSQLSYLAGQLESYHANDMEILSMAKKAMEMNEGGNAQGSASVIYNIMNRPEKTEKDHENYAAMTFTAQQMGDNLFQQLQLQQYSQKSNPEAVQAGGYETHKPSFGQGQGQGQSYNEMNYQGETQQQQQPQPQHSSYGNQMGGGYNSGGGFGFGGNQGSNNYGQQQQYYQQAHY